MITQDVLYVIKHLKSETIKIGITTQWQNRAKLLRVGSDTKLLGLFQTLDVRETELELHHKFKEFRLPGSEYFLLTEHLTEHLLRYLQENFKDLTDYFSSYELIAKSQKLNITGALSWSGNEWFRRNHESWRKSPIVYANAYLHKNSFLYNEKDLKIFEKQIDEIIDICKIVSHFGGKGEQESFAACKIWKSIIQASDFYIDKRLFKKRVYPKMIEYCLPKNFNLENIEASIPKDIELDKTDFKLHPSVVNIVYALAAPYRLKCNAERAYETSMNIKDFHYYLESYGPKN